MRLPNHHAPWLLLLLPTLALASSSLDTVSGGTGVDSVTGKSKAKFEIGTKDAPIDGRDGKPHEGPFVDTGKKGDKSDDINLKSLTALKDAPADPTIYEGKKIPESNDGVMDDPNHPSPKHGTTGTGGGVSEKDKARKAMESKTGGKLENVPETPKEAPPLPHSEQEKILGSNKDKTSKGGESEKAAAGLDKPTDLPQKFRDSPNPLPESANKDHLDVSKPAPATWSGGGSADDATEGLIQPFHSFMLSLTMILFSEIGDKTFLVAALMAMKHDRMVVFSAAFGALLVMTVLSAVLGHTVPALIPKRVTAFLAAGLFVVFGVKMLREGLAMSPDEGVSAEMQEVEMELEEKEAEAIKLGRRRSSVTPHAMELGLGGGGGRSRKSRSEGRFPTPPRSPSTSPARSPSPGGAGGAAGFVGGLGVGMANLFSLLLSPAWVQTFVMTFLGEWGDRSQIATIAMAAGQDWWWVTLGAGVGHACCTSVAVVGGRAIAGRVSLKVVTVGGAVAFLVFGVIYFVEAFYA